MLVAVVGMAGEAALQRGGGGRAAAGQEEPEQDPIHRRHDAAQVVRGSVVLTGGELGGGMLR